MVGRLRILWRRGREAPILRPLLAALDKLWWARVIRQAQIVDLAFVHAQGNRMSSRAAIRAYVRGGHQHGFSLNPLILEKMVASQLPESGRVPALYAYLVSDPGAVRTTPAWDSVAYARAHPESLVAAGGPVGHAWRAAEETNQIVLGSDASSTRPWNLVHERLVDAARAARGDGEPSLPASLNAPVVLVTRVGAQEWGAGAALTAAGTFAARNDVAVIVAVEGRSADVWAAAALLAESVDSGHVLRDSPALVRDVELACTQDAVIVTRGIAAEISSEHLAALAASAERIPTSPLWLAPDGTIAAAGTVTDGGAAFPLLRGHPREDVSALGREIRVSATAGSTLARRISASPDARANVLLEAIVRAPIPAVESFRSAGPEVDVSTLLAPTSLRVAGRTPHGPVLSRPSRLVELSDGTMTPGLRWALKIAAPPGPPGESWGDTHFARGIADALRRLGQEVVIDAYDARDRPSHRLDDVMLSLRGPEPIEAHADSLSLLWVISHPDELTEEEVAGFDVVFAASTEWAASASARWGRQIAPLLQCTDVHRFRPRGLPRSNEIVFVGTARGIERPSVLRPIEAGVPVSVYGPDWRGWIPASAIKALGVPNSALPAVYEQAAVVLNDHWPAMQSSGFVSNRLFDVVAAGGRAISDDVAGISDIFGAAVATYRTPSELVAMLTGDLDGLFPTPARLADISREVRREHSFDHRARQLLDAALTAREERG